MDAIGRELRARRTAAGRTVASVAADAGLSVPYIANLENGRGNPTITALSRLAQALGLRLAVTLEAGGEVTPPRMPASLTRLGRTERFRRAVTTLAGASSQEAGETSARLVPALAMLAQATGKDLSQADWWRVLDALVLIVTHPADQL